MSGNLKYGRIWGLLAALALLFGLPYDAGGQNDLPDKPDLIRVTVDHADNGVLIQWEPSTDTDIKYYHLYRMEDRTGQLLFTFGPETLEYKHMTGGLENLAYTVTAEDSAGNESLLEDNEHRAVSITLEFDPCAPAVTVNWTGYVGWEGRISGYRIYGAIEGTEPVMLKFVSASTRTFTHQGVAIDASYRYYIEAVNTSGLTSQSPLGTIRTVFPDPPSFLRVDYVSVIDRSAVEIQFSADTESPANNFRILKRSSDHAPFTEVETFWNSTQSTQTVRDNFLTSGTSFEYIVQSIYQPEGCTDPIVVSESNPGTSMLLQSSVEDQMAVLEWTPYRNYETGLSGYLIQRRNGRGEFINLQSVGPETTSWRETIESVIDGYQPGQLQYKVLAVANQVPGQDPGISISNVVNVAVETHLQVPSAFTPGSSDMNNEFRPLIDFAPREYVLIVFDRGGRKLFETTDPVQGWDGSYSGGSYVMEGVYVWFIQYTDYTGRSKSLSGNVTAIYP